MTPDALPGSCRRLEIPLNDAFEWDRLDAAAFRVSVKRSVRWLAWFEAGLGAVAAVCGFAAPFVPLAVIGLVLVAVGVWNLCRTSITGVLVDGVAMILTGLFHCLAWLWIDDARSSSAGKWTLTGLIQIAWGIRRLRIYPAARFAPNDRQAIARLESIVRELSKRNAKDDPAVAEFWTGRIRRHRNRLGLYAEGAVALLEHQAVRLEKRSEIWVEARGTTLSNRSVKVGIQMGDLKLTGEMPAEHFERFERWKLGGAQAHPIAA